MREKGYTLVELMVVVAIIGVLLLMALPNYYRMRLSTRAAVCQNNLRQIGAAVDRWVFENNINEGAIPSPADEDVIYSYLRSGKPECPAGGTYTISVIGTFPQVTCNVEGHTLITGN